MLTKAEVYLLLEALADKYGRGYSDKPEVGQLQAKLSMMGEMAAARESREGKTDGR